MNTQHHDDTASLNRFHKAAEASPTRTGWAIHISEFDSEPIFAWFKTREDFLDYVASGDIRALNEESDPTKLREIAESVRAGTVSFEDAVEKIDEALGSANLHWWGSVEELLTGDSDLAREVRAYCRESTGQGDHPANAHEVDAFLDTMRHFPL